MKRKGRRGCSSAAGRGGGFIYFVSREFCPQGLPGPHRLLLLATGPAVLGPCCLSRHSRLLKLWERVSSLATSFDSSIRLNLHAAILPGACSPLPDPPCSNDVSNSEPQRWSRHDAPRISCAVSQPKAHPPASSMLPRRRLAATRGVQHSSPSIYVDFSLPAVQGQRSLRHAHSSAL